MPLSIRFAPELRAACDLSIVIVNWNTRQLLAQCLESVTSDQSAATSDQKQGCNIYLLPTVHRSLSTEVIVVDNASTDGSASMVRERFPSVRLIENRANAGFAQANNQAICYSRGRYVLLLNSDTVVHPGALEALVAFMEAHPRAAAAGARLLNGDGSVQPSCHPMLTPEREFWRLLFLEHVQRRATYPVHAWNNHTPCQVEVIKGACLLLRREAVDQVGLLDDRYFMYTEEVDLCYRLAQAGWQLWYVPVACVTHFGEASSRQVAEAMYVQLYRSKVQFYRKFGTEGRVRRYKAMMAAVYAPRALVASVASLGSASWRPWARTYRRLLAELPSM